MISIITPCYNSEKYISKTIESVLMQTYDDFELIVVDDFSTDNSVDIIKGFVDNDSRVKLIQLYQNYGSAIARNKGIALAKGRYIAFLDSDDRWLPEKLAKQLAFMQEKNIAFSYTAYEKINESGECAGYVGVPERVSYSDLLKVCSIGCLTAMYDTEKLGKFYMPLIRKRQDLGLWLRILKKIPYAYGMNEILAQYQLRSDSISANKRSAAQYTWRLYRDVEKLNFFVASYYFSNYAVRGLLRTKFPSIARAIGVLK